MNAATATDPCICTLLRPEGMNDRTWTGQTWTWNTPSTTFVALDSDRVWLLTAGSRSEWRCMATADARAEYKRLRALGYTRSEKHLVDLVAAAELHADAVHEMERDNGLNLFRSGTACAGLCPVLRSTDYRYRDSSWSICLDVTITQDTSGVRKVGTRSVETCSVYGYEVAEQIMADDGPRYGWSFTGLSDKIGVRRYSYEGRLGYTTRNLPA
jgi:hypothetical protein